MNSFLTIGRQKTVLARYCFLVFLFLGLFFAFFAVSKAIALNSDLTKWYETDSVIEPGQIVSFVNDKADYVELSSQSNRSRILGVVVADQEATLSIDKKDSAVQVAIAGRTLVKIDPGSGAINRGDFVTSSDLSFAQRAGAGDAVLGVAEASSEGIDEVDGFKLLPVIVNPKTLASGTGELDNNVFAKLAGKNVSVLQVAFSVAIAIIGLVTIGFLSYSSIKNGVVSVGRNPLARPAILSALAQVMLMVSIVALVSIGLMYITLKF